MREPAVVDKIERAREHFFRFGRKADDEIGAEDDIGSRLAKRAAKVDCVLARMAPLHALQDQIVAGLQRQMKMRAEPRVFGDRRAQVVIDFDAVDRREPQTRQIGKFAQQQTHEAPERPAVAKIGAIARQIDAGKHDFFLAGRDERARLRDDLGRRRRARRAASKWNDAEGATMVAAILHREQAAGAFIGAKRAIWRVLGNHARHAVDLGEALWIDAHGAAGDDDFGGRALAMQAADGLPRLPRRFARHRAGVDDEGLALAGMRARELLRLDDVEAAAEGDDLGAA